MEVSGINSAPQASKKRKGNTTTTTTTKSRLHEPKESYSGSMDDPPRLILFEQYIFI